MSTRIGKQAVRISQGWEFSPTYGQQQIEQWSGKLGALRSLASSFNGAGYQTSYIEQEGRTILRVIIGNFDDGEDEVPIDRFEIATEMFQVSIWTHPRVMLAMYPVGVSTAAKAAASADRKAIEDAVSNGQGFPSSQVSTVFQTVGEQVFDQLVRGIDTDDQKRYTLSRVRTVSVNFVDTTKYEAIDTIYLTATLKTTFSIPSIVGDRLPDDPIDSPDGQTWGWRLRDDSRILLTSSNRMEESKSWIFAPWTNLFYNIA